MGVALKLPALSAVSSRSQNAPIGRCRRINAQHPQAYGIPVAFTDLRMSKRGVNALGKTNGSRAAGSDPLSGRVTRRVKCL